jgi:hypothetical protein
VQVEELVVTAIVEDGHGAPALRFRFGVVLLHGTLLGRVVSPNCECIRNKKPALAVKGKLGKIVIRQSLGR